MLTPVYFPGTMLHVCAYSFIDDTEIFSIRLCGAHYLREASTLGQENPSERPFLTTWIEVHGCRLCDAENARKLTSLT